jgi:hypothetical protein
MVVKRLLRTELWVAPGRMIWRREKFRETSDESASDFFLLVLENTYFSARHSCSLLETAVPHYKDV